MGISEVISKITDAINIAERAGFELFISFVNGPVWRVFVATMAVFFFIVLGLRIARTLQRERAWHLTFIRLLFGHAVYLSAALFGVGIVLLSINAHSYSQNYLDSVWYTEFWANVDARAYPTVWGAGTGLVLAGLGIYSWGRWTEPALSEWLAARTRGINNDWLTDVREIEKILPAQLNYDPKKYFSIEKNRLFFGLDENKIPIYIPREDWIKTHVQIVGTTGFGKGIQAGVVLSQSVLFDDAVFVFDPKSDVWLPSVLAATCRSVGKDFLLIDLRAGQPPQINPFFESNAAETAGLLDAVFDLSDTGQASDFYRSNDRRALRIIAQLADEKPICIPGLSDQFNSIIEERKPDLLGQADGLFSKLEELAGLSVVQTIEGGQLEKILSGGGCCYIIGETLDEQVIKLQKMLFVRLVQLIRKRPRDGQQRHVTCFLDEFKYLISPAIINSFGIVRDCGMNLMLAHQTNRDFFACAGLRPEAVQGAILDNTALKWIYQTKDPKDAENVAGMTGRVLVKIARGDIERNAQLAEHVEGERGYIEVERYKFDVNMIQNLPAGCAVVIGHGQARLAFASPILVERREFSVTEASMYTASVDPFSPIEQQEQPHDEDDLL